MTFLLCLREKLTEAQIICDLAMITHADRESHKENQQTSVAYSKNEHKLSKINLRNERLEKM